MGRLLLIGKAERFVYKNDVGLSEVVFVWDEMFDGRLIPGNNTRKGVLMSVQILPKPPTLSIATLIASSGFVQPVSPELQVDVDTHLHEGQLLYSIVSRGETIGFAIFKMFGEVLYLAGIILREDHQGKGIAPQVVDLARAATGAQWLGLRTQSPVMWASASKMVRTLFPHPSTGDVQTYLAAQELARDLGMSQVIHPGFYGGPLYGQKPTHHDPRIQNWWDSLCQFERGDAVVVAGKF